MSEGPFEVQVYSGAEWRTREEHYDREQALVAARGLATRDPIAVRVVQEYLDPDDGLFKTRIYFRRAPQDAAGAGSEAEMPSGVQTAAASPSVSSRARPSVGGGAMAAGAPPGDRPANQVWFAIRSLVVLLILVTLLFAFYRYFAELIQ